MFKVFILLLMFNNAFADDELIAAPEINKEHDIPDININIDDILNKTQNTNIEIKTPAPIAIDTKKPEPPKEDNKPKEIPKPIISVPKVEVKEEKKPDPVIRPLQKLDADRKIKGDESHREVVVPDLHEDSSTESTYNSPSEVEFPKRSIVEKPNIIPPAEQLKEKLPDNITKAERTKQEKASVPKVQIIEEKDKNLPDIKLDDFKPPLSQDISKPQPEINLMPKNNVNLDSKPITKKELVFDGILNEDVQKKDKIKKKDSKKSLDIIKSEELWVNSFMFSTQESIDLSAAVNEFVTGISNNKTEEPNKTAKQNGNNILSKITKKDFIIVVNSIVYFSKDKWSIWINKKKYTNDDSLNSEEGFDILEISPSKVRIKLYITQKIVTPENVVLSSNKKIPNAKIIKYNPGDDYVEFDLYPNQKFSSEKMQIFEAS